MRIPGCLICVNDRAWGTGRPRRRRIPEFGGMKKKVANFMVNRVDLHYNNNIVFASCRRGERLRVTIPPAFGGFRRSFFKEKNMRKMLFIAMLCLSAVFTMSIASESPMPDVIKVTNSTENVFYEMLISPSADDDWDYTNQFGAVVLDAGDSVYINKEIFTKKGLYDITFTDTNEGDYFIWDVDVKKTTEITVTMEDFDDV